MYKHGSLSLILDSCGPIYQIGDCFAETKVDSEHAFPCPTLDDYEEEITFTKRRCGSDGTWSHLNEVYDCSFFKNETDYVSYDSYDYVYVENDYLISNVTINMNYNMNITTSNGTFNGTIEAPDPSLAISLAMLSFLFSIVSFILMAVLIRKCTRIYIHMNLLAAHMLR